MSATPERMDTPAVQQGREARKRMPRGDHARWSAKELPRDIIAILRAADRGRLKRLLPLKYARMSVSPFSFYRGSVALMAADLGRRPHSGLLTQLCGDTHILNLGAFAGLDETILFDINDFDETLRGPFEWDVKRLATSLILAGREAGASAQACRDAAERALRRYRKAMHRFAEMPVLELARFQVHRRRSLRSVAEVFRKAERSTPLHTLAGLTEAEPDHRHAGPSPRRFRSEPPVLEALEGERAEKVLASLQPYLATLEPQRRHFLSRYTPLAAAFRVVGTGSVGLRAYVVYLQGNGSGDPLFLQIKQEVASAWAPYLPDTEPPEPGAVRVVTGQRAMQLQTDPFLGTTGIGPHSFLVRQFNDHKSSVSIGELAAADLLPYAELCGEVLARGHARAGEPRALAAYLGRGPRFDEAVTRFAHAYADQTEADWKRFRAWTHAKTRAKRGRAAGPNASAEDRTRTR